MIDTDAFLEDLARRGIDTSTLTRDELLGLIFEHVAESQRDRIPAGMSVADVARGLRTAMGDDPNIGRLVDELLLHLQNQ